MRIGINDEAKRNACFICGRPTVVGLRVGIGEGRWRHEDCVPGSRQWMKSERAKVSPLRHLFLETNIK